VNHVLVVKAPYDVGYGVNAPYVCQELVSQPLSLAGPPYQARNVNELYGRRRDFLGLDYLGNFVEPLVGNFYYSNVWLNRAKGVVGRLGPRRKVL